METPKSDDAGEAKKKMDRLEKQLANKRWANVYACERCSQETLIMNDAVVQMCGGIHARLCLACRRDWDVDDTVTDLLHAVNLHQVRSSAFQHGGDADKAEEAFIASDYSRDKLRAYSLLWLAEKIERKDADAEE